MPLLKQHRRPMAPFPAKHICYVCGSRWKKLAYYLWHIEKCYGQAVALSMQGKEGRYTIRLVRRYYGLSIPVTVNGGIQFIKYPIDVYEGIYGRFSVCMTKDRCIVYSCVVDVNYGKLTK